MPRSLEEFRPKTRPKGKKFEKKDYHNQYHNNNNRHIDNFQTRNQEGPRNNQSNEQRQERQEQEDRTPINNRLGAGVIVIVTEGLLSGRPSSSKRKRYAKVHTIMAQKKKPRTWKDEAIFFNSKDLEGVHTPNDDAIVVTATIYNHVAKRVLFDNGSANDVLYYDAMKKLGILDDQLKPFPMSLIKFKNEKVKV